MADKRVSFSDKVRGLAGDVLFVKLRDVVFRCAGVAIERAYDELGRRERYVESVEHVGSYTPYLNGVPLSFKGEALAVDILTVEDNLFFSGEDFAEERSQALRETHALGSQQALTDWFFRVHDTNEDLVDFVGNEDKILSELRAMIEISDEYEAAERMHIEFRPTDRFGSLAQVLGLGMRMGQLESEITEALEEQGDPGSYQLPIMFMDTMFFWYANVREDGQVDARTFYGSEDELREKFEKLLKTAPLMRGSHADVKESLLPYWNGDIQMNTGMSGNF